MALETKFYKMILKQQNGNENKVRESKSYFVKMLTMYLSVTIYIEFTYLERKINSLMSFFDLQNHCVICNLN